MRRIGFVVVLVLGLLAPLASEAQQARKLPRIGVLWHEGSAEEATIYLGALRQGFTDLGYVEGKTIVLENRFAAEQPERFSSLAAELVDLKADVLVAVTRLSALAAQRATTTIPIVFVVVPDPVGSKLVDSLARPGGNITGLSNMALDLSAKRVELLKEAIVGLSLVGLLVNLNDKAGTQRYLDESQTAASRLRVTLEPIGIRAGPDLDAAFSTMLQKRIQGLVVPSDGLFFQQRQRIADLAMAHRLPVMVYSRETVEAGALMAFGPSHRAIFRRTAIYVEKILKGAKPADLPVEQPTKFEFIINLKTAKALGRTIPPSLLLRADQVIE